MGLAIEVFNLGGHPTVKRSDGTHLGRVEGRAEQNCVGNEKSESYCSLYHRVIFVFLSLIFFDFDPELDEPEAVGTKKWS